MWLFRDMLQRTKLKKFSKIYFFFNIDTCLCRWTKWLRGTDGMFSILAARIWPAGSRLETPDPTLALYSAMTNHYCLIRLPSWYGPWVWHKINLSIKDGINPPKKRSQPGNLRQTVHQTRRWRLHSPSPHMNQSEQYSTTHSTQLHFNETHNKTVDFHDTP